MKRLQKGFTLIELMIVIAIIAILAAILIPNFLHARAESQTAACEGNQKQLATAFEEYAVDNSGIYPASANPITGGAGGTFGANGGTYLQVAPTDPVNNVGYVYNNLFPGGGGDCALPANTQGYEILDTGGHDPTVKIANAALGAKTVYYCSGAGINGK